MSTAMMRAVATLIRADHEAVTQRTDKRERDTLLAVADWLDYAASCVMPPPYARAVARAYLGEQE